MSSLIPNLVFKVETIRTTKHNKNVDSYEYPADFKMIGKDKTEYFTYMNQQMKEKNFM